MSFQNSNDDSSSHYIMNLSYLNLQNRLAPEKNESIIKISQKK